MIKSEEDLEEALSRPTEADIAAALSAISQLDLDEPPRVLITGSLYLAGEVLSANGTPPT